MGRRTVAGGSSPTLVDLGGNIGMYTLAAAAAGYHVVVFEPVPESSSTCCTSVTAFARGASLSMTAGSAQRRRIGRYSQSGPFVAARRPSTTLSGARAEAVVAPQLKLNAGMCVCRVQCPNTYSTYVR